MQRADKNWNVCVRGTRTIGTIRIHKQQMRALLHVTRQNSVRLSAPQIGCLVERGGQKACVLAGLTRGCLPRHSAGECPRSRPPPHPAHRSFLITLKNTSSSHCSSVLATTVSAGPSELYVLAMNTNVNACEVRIGIGRG